MKYKVTALLLIIMIFTFIQPLSAMTKEVLVEINGKEMNFQGTFIEKGRTLVPLAFFDEIAVKVTVDQQVITIEDAYTSVKLTIDNEYALIYHKYDLTGIPEEVKLDVMPKQIGGVNFIPLRFVAETLNIKVGWNGEENKVILTTDKVYNKSVEFSIIDPIVTPMTDELTNWIYENVKVKGIEYKTIGEYTYIKIQAGEMPTGGYKINIKGLYNLGEGKIFINGDLVKPGPNDVVIQIFTYPLEVVKVKKEDLPLKNGHMTIIGEIE